LQGLEHEWEQQLGARQFAQLRNLLTSCTRSPLPQPSRARRNDRPHPVR
jgi:hypothetical protein